MKRKRVKAKTRVANDIDTIADGLEMLAAFLREDRVTRKTRDEIAGSLLRARNDAAAISKKVRRFTASSV